MSKEGMFFLTNKIFIAFYCQDKRLSFDAATPGIVFLLRYFNIHLAY